MRMMSNMLGFHLYFSEIKHPNICQIHKYLLERKQAQLNCKKCRCLPILKFLEETPASVILNAQVF